MAGTRGGLTSGLKRARGRKETATGAPRRPLRNGAHVVTRPCAEGRSAGTLKEVGSVAAADRSGVERTGEPESLLDPLKAGANAVTAGISSR